jgi:hypothetical protein
MTCILLLRILSQQVDDNKKSMFQDMLPYCAEGTPLLLKAMQ